MAWRLSCSLLAAIPPRFSGRIPISGRALRGSPVAAQPNVLRRDVARGDVQTHVVMLSGLGE